jgi:hypothetical protein
MRARACARAGHLTKACTHKTAIGDSELIKVRLAGFAESSRTSRKV